MLACSAIHDTGRLTRTEAVSVVVTVEGIRTKALVYTGAACSLVNTSAFPTLNWDEIPREAVSITLQSVEGRTIETNANYRLRIGFGDDELVAILCLSQLELYTTAGDGLPHTLWGSRRL